MIFNPVYGGNASANLGSKTITANGTYLASSDNLDGYDEVTANVPNSYTASDEGKVVKSQVGYIRTNNVALNITLSNWLYRTSDKFVLEYKNYGAHQATTFGVFGRFLETSSGDSAQLALQYNTYGGRKCMNIAHAGSWAGDSNYTFDAPDNLVKYYELTGDGNSFVMKSGSSRDSYTTTEFSQTVGSSSDTDTTTVKLFPPNSGNVLNVEFYGLRVYRGGTLIHNYQPSDGGVYDAVDGTTYLATASGGTYGGGSYTLVAQTSRNISANDTYDTTLNDEIVVNVPNSYSASDEGKVVSNGALVAQTSATYSTNNTYDTTLINSVTVNVPSSGGIEVITRSDWNALSVAQKQAYGLIAIQDAITGFDRGELVYGADYIPLGIYIPNSTASDILCEAYLSNFDATSTSWGFGSIPITLTTMASMQDNSVLLDAYNGGAYGYVDLGAASTPFTAYVVAKTTAGSNYRRIISAMNARSSGQGMLLYGTTVNISSWANDTSTGISSTAAYFVGVIRFASSGNAKGFVKNASSNLVSVAKTPSAAGRYVTIGRTDPNASTSNAEPTSLLVKYIAVVSGAESDAVIEANINNLISSFLS